ncbi:MAG: leucyl aminopeptidase, partial [Deltaproteobacteria bacterium]|nr:leucyl aminopeptidase [Deltaproteobacteria bacterium]
IKNDNGNKPLKEVTLLATDAGDAARARTAVRRAEIICRGTLLARDLVSRPSNSATPTFLAGTARRVARKHGLACKVLDEKQAFKLGMGSYLSVARGTDEPARFIVLEYKPKRQKATATVALIGKAITFDSGGISLKPPGGMEEMKTDMAGGAAVLGAMQAVAALKLPVHVVGLVPATENLPSGHALKPGDIVKAMSGKTIEIISTDAEGRLVMADALHYAKRYKPAAMIDLATLTGACVIALGNDASGIMGTDERLVARIRKAADATGEKVWQLPLWDEYREQIKSDVADIKNVGGRAAGTITAGCFLKEFVDEIPWVHIDIAGTAWLKKDNPYTPKGASGVGVRLLVEMLEKWE